MSGEQGRWIRAVDDPVELAWGARIIRQALARKRQREADAHRATTALDVAAVGDASPVKPATASPARVDKPAA